MRRRSRKGAKIYGQWAETIAVLWLRCKFYRILDRAYRIREGEIDIIAMRGATIAFVEVKARPTLEAAALAISPQKTRRISRAARAWIAAHPWAMRYILRGDGIYVAPWRPPQHVCAALTLELD